MLVQTCDSHGLSRHVKCGTREEPSTQIPPMGKSVDGSISWALPPVGLVAVCALGSNNDN